MNGLEATIGINGFSNGFWSINHWSRWFFRLATIGLDGFAMVFGLVTIGLDGFSMVANHWSNDGSIIMDRRGLPSNVASLYFALKVFEIPCLFQLQYLGHKSFSFVYS